MRLDSMMYDNRKWNICKPSAIDPDQTLQKQIDDENLVEGNGAAMSGCIHSINYRSSISYDVINGTREIEHRAGDNCSADVNMSRLSSDHGSIHYPTASRIFSEPILSKILSKTDYRDKSRQGIEFLNQQVHEEVEEREEDEEVAENKYKIVTNTVSFKVIHQLNKEVVGGSTINLQPTLSTAGMSMSDSSQTVLLTQSQSLSISVSQSLSYLHSTSSSDDSETRTSSSDRSTSSFYTGSRHSVEYYYDKYEPGSILDLFQCGPTTIETDLIPSHIIDNEDTMTDVSDNDESSDIENSSSTCDYKKERENSKEEVREDISIHLESIECIHVSSGVVHCDLVESEDKKNSADSTSMKNWKVNTGRSYEKDSEEGDEDEEFLSEEDNSDQEETDDSDNDEKLSDYDYYSSSSSEESDIVMRIRLSAS